MMTKRFFSVYLTTIFLLAASIGHAADETTFSSKDLTNRRVVVLGDSITQAGQYVSFLNYYLLRQHPKASIDIVSIGLSSETASGLSENDHPFPRPCIHERLKRALTKTKPEVILACYGMNDGIYHPANPARDQAYKDGIMKLIKTATAGGVKHILLLTPGTFDASARKTYETGEFSYKRPFTRYDDVLAGYGKWIMALDLPNLTPLDLHSPMAVHVKKMRQSTPTFRLAKDGIHPNALGHLIMAQAILSPLGIPASKDPEAELNRLNGDPLYKLANQHRQTRSKGWLPYVGYVRGKSVQAHTIDPTEAQATSLMTKIDNLRQKP